MLRKRTRIVRPIQLATSAELKDDETSQRLRSRGLTIPPDNAKVKVPGPFGQMARDL
ncbi:MAG TPA: hypothetical protein VED84_00985 [Acidimicrobiales bacterium]|nr:hypothetical protein [Acidimicrobiales bacterium]